MASIYQNLFKTNPNRELYLKVELIDSNEPEWINSTGINTTIVPYAPGGLTSSTIFGITIPNIFDGYRLNSIETGDIIKSYPSNTGQSNDLFNQYSFPINQIISGSAGITFLVDNSTVGADISNIVQNTQPTINVGRFYFVKKEVFGKLLSGGLNIDVDNSTRRTINLGFSVDLLDDNANLKINDFQNKRIKIYIGLKNLLNENFLRTESNSLFPDSKNIVWFKMGVFNVTEISMEHSVDSISISMSAQDKSALTDGSAGGIFGEPPPTSYYDQSSAVSFYDLISDFLINYSYQQPDKININFGNPNATSLFSNYFLSFLGYNSGSTSSYSIQNYNNIGITSAGNSTFSGLQVPVGMTVYSNFYWATTTAYTTPLGVTLFYPQGITDGLGFSTLTFSGYTSIYSSGVTAGNFWRELKPVQLIKDNTGSLYYEDQPLQFKANDSVLSSIQNIVNQLPNQYNYYFDENGDFNLERKKLTGEIVSFVDPLKLKVSSYSSDTTPFDNNFSTFFSDSVLVNSYSHQKRFSSLKNDISVFGLNGIAYVPGVSTSYDTVGSTTYIQINNQEVLYHTVITTLPSEVRNGFSSGYGTGTTIYGHPFQQYIIDKTTNNPQNNIDLGLSILKDYAPELKSRFEFLPVAGITEWSIGFTSLGPGSTVYVGKTNNYYLLTSEFTQDDWSSNPIDNYPTNIAATYQGAKFLGTYNPYYGIYRKILPTDPGAVAIDYSGVSFYYVTSTTAQPGVTTRHFGVYRSKMTGNPSIDFDVSNPLGDYTTWLYWFDVLDEKLNFWSPTTGYSTGTYVFYNDKTYNAGAPIAPGFADPESFTAINNTRSLFFDGSADRVDTGTTSIGPVSLFADSSQQWTIEFWFNSTALPATGTADWLINKSFGTGVNTARTFQIRVAANGNIQSWIRGSSTALATAVPLNQWNHLAVTWDGTTARSYLNGGSPVTCNVGTAVEETSERIWFGGYFSSNSYNGYLSDIRIWNNARTQSQIQINKDWRLSGNEVDLIGYWRLNDSVGSNTAIDYAGSNNGIVTGAMFSSNSPFTGAIISWNVARQGYGIYDISIEKQGIRKIRQEDQTINVGFKKNIDRFTGNKQILFIRNSISYNVEEFNSRLNELLNYLYGLNLGVNSFYILLYDTGSNYKTDPFNKILPVDTAQYADAFNLMKEVLYKYTTLEDNVSLQTLPVYAFNVDSKINVIDDYLNINSNYYIRSLSIPLDNQAMMSVEGIKITPFFIGSGLNNPSAIEVANFTTTSSDVFVQKYFVTDSQNKSLSVFSSTISSPESVILLDLLNVVEINYFKDSDGINKLFILSSDFRAVIYNIDTGELTSNNLATGTVVNSTNFQTVDSFSGGISDPYIYVLCIPNSDARNVRILKINKNNLTKTIEIINQSDLPTKLSTGYKAAFCSPETGTYILFMETDNFYVSTFTAGANCVLQSSVSINDFYEKIENLKGESQLKIQYIGGSEPAYYLSADNNIFRIKDISSSFSGVTYSFNAFPGLSTSGVAAALLSATTSYQVYPTQNTAGNFFTTVALTQMQLNNIYTPFTTTSPLGSTIIFDFSTNAFGAYSITTAIGTIRTDNIASDTSTLGLFFGGTGLTVGSMLGMGGVTVPIKYIQPISSNKTFYSQIVKDSSPDAGVFSGIENVFIYPQNNYIYIVAGSVIYEVTDPYLNNVSANQIFT
jgi:hypothetical protein